MLQQQSVSFQPVNHAHAQLPPYIESARNLLFGKPKLDQLSCRQLSRFDSFETISKNSADYRQKITFLDDFESETINRSLDHLLSKHGHNFGIHDPLPTNPKQKASPYLQPRTRTNVQNREQFFKNLNQFAQNPDLEVFKDVLMRGQLGRVYLCSETERVIAIVMEGPQAGTVIKAQPINEQQRTLLETQNKLD